MEKIRVIVKRPDEQFGHVTNISNTLENLQRTVDGPIEVVRLDYGVIMIVNEEGKLRRLPRNFECLIDCGAFTYRRDVIAGTVIVAGEKEDEFSDCPISLQNWKELLKGWGN